MAHEAAGERHGGVGTCHGVVSHGGDRGDERPCHGVSARLSRLSVGYKWYCNRVDSDS
ncbi:hypothetical protein [Duncaniella dubosii]|nr:hypothetical protein [Duncaniella dubosii]